MRWLLGTLLAGSHPLPRCPIAGSSPSRHRPAILSQQVLPQLAEEEFKALAGVWRAELELDDGATALSLHLAAPTSLHYGTTAPGGKVFPMEEKLPFNICQSGGSDGYSSAWWSAYSVGNDGNLHLELQLGNLYFEGRGERSGLRCSTFVGMVLEGGEDPCVVGRFLMRLSLPTTSDAKGLEERYRHRLASRPLPPIIYPRSGFVGRWRLLLSMDDETPISQHAQQLETPGGNKYMPTAHAFIPIELSADCSWQSVGTEQTLAGTWGMYSRDPQAVYGRGGWSTVEPSGSSVWLKVDRERCTETLRGVAGLPVRSDFQMSGKPVHESEGQLLAARAAGEGGALADRVEGRLWMGAVDRAYFGRFSLLRGDSVELSERCEEGDAAACETLSQEDQAKREWLAEREAEAKRKWLARLEVPVITPPRRVVGYEDEVVEVLTEAEEAAELDEKCDSGDDTACETLSKEEEAMKAWLARLDAPAALSEQCDSGDDVACDTISKEETAKRAW